MKQQPEIIPIFFATDNGYAPVLGVALASLLANLSARCEARIYILTEGLTEENCRLLREITVNRASLDFVDVSAELKELDGRLYLRDYYSRATYFRFFISRLFPEYRKALYLDCDIVVRADISRLFHVPLGRNLVAAVQEEVMAETPVFGNYVEAVLEMPCAEYFNAGVLVMNLAEFRRRRVDDLFIRLLGERKYDVTQDQDYLNVLCRGSSVLVDTEWNKTPFYTNAFGTREPLLVHYKLNWKPWHYDGVLYEEYFWEYAEKTGFYPQLRAMRHAFTAEDARRDTLAYQQLCLLAAKETEEAGQNGFDEAAMRTCHV